MLIWRKKMTVSTEVSHNEYTGNGVTTTFPYTFRILKKTDLVVQTLDGNDNITTLVMDTNYSVTGVGSYSGGNIVLSLPLAIGWRITIVRELDVVQETDLRNQGKFFAEVHENAFDYLTMLIQQSFSWLRLALLKPNLMAKYYDAKQNKISNLADPAADQDAVNNRTMMDYVDRAVAGVIGGYGWFIQNFQGAVYRTFQNKMREDLSVFDFGVIGDGNYHPLSERFASLAEAQASFPFVTSLTQSIDWAGCQAAAQSKRRVTIPRKAYVLTDGLTFAGGTVFEGEGIGRWVPGYTAIFPPTLDDGVNFLMYGTGAKLHALKGVSRNDVSGGSITNPSAGDPYTSTAPSPRYDLLDFTNRDASGATAATQKLFSAAVVLPAEGGVTISNCRFVPWFNGLTGYTDLNELGMGDEWDVGIYENCSGQNSLENVQVVGYWRVAAHLKALVADGVSAGNGESSNYTHCTFQGYRGVAIRSLDQFRITAVTANTIEIPWSSGHQFPQAGVLRSAGINFSYTGLSYAGDKLTFTGIASTAGAVVGSSIRLFTSDTFGMAGTQYVDCWITGLYHASRLLSTSVHLGSVFETHSAALEWSGEPARGLQFIGCTLQNFDDILIMTIDAGDPMFVGTYMESQSTRSVPGGPVNAIAVGGRIIAHSSSLSAAPYPAGATRNFRMVGCTYGPGVDKGPLYPLTGGRFVSGTGCFKPRESYDEGEAFPSFVNGEVRHVSAANAGIQPAVGFKTVVGPSSGNAMLQSRVGELILQSGLRVRIGDASNNNWYTMTSSAITPFTDNAFSCGDTTVRWNRTYSREYFLGSGGSRILNGSGSPEGSVSANVGSVYTRTDGVAGATMYVKESGAGNTGWAAK